MTEVGFPTDSLTTCSGCGILAGEQEQKILQLIAMNHSLKRELDAKDAEIAALREAVRWEGEQISWYNKQVWFNCHPVVRNILEASHE